jgi:hypothetical protein
MVSLGSPGAEQLVMVIQGSTASPPRGHHQQLKHVRGTIAQACYIQQHDLCHWALAEEDTDGSKWIVLHMCSEGRKL